MLGLLYTRLVIHVEERLLRFHEQTQKYVNGKILYKLDILSHIQLSHEHCTCVFNSRLKASRVTLHEYAAAAAKSRQSCPTLCDPIDCSHQAPLSMGFFQARVHSVAISLDPNTAKLRLICLQNKSVS